jgi:hypothetical protein
LDNTSRGLEQRGIGAGWKQSTIEEDRYWLAVEQIKVPEERVRSRDPEKSRTNDVAGDSAEGVGEIDGQQGPTFAFEGSAGRMNHTVGTGTGADTELVSSGCLVAGRLVKLNKALPQETGHRFTSDDRTKATSGLGEEGQRTRQQEVAEGWRTGRTKQQQEEVSEDFDATRVVGEEELEVGKAEPRGTRSCRWWTGSQDLGDQRRR